MSADPIPQPVTLEEFAEIIKAIVTGSSEVAVSEAVDSTLPTVMLDPEASGFLERWGAIHWIGAQIHNGRIQAARGYPSAWAPKSITTSVKVGAAAKKSVLAQISFQTPERGEVALLYMATEELRVQHERLLREVSSAKERSGAISFLLKACETHKVKGTWELPLDVLQKCATKVEQAWA